MQKGALLMQKIPDEGGDITLVLAGLRHNKAVMALVFLAVIGAALLYVVKIPQQFVATADILMLPSSVDNAGGGHLVDVADVRSRIAVMQSPERVRRLIARTDLHHRAEVGGVSGDIAYTDLPLHRQDKIMHAVQKRLSVKPVLGTTMAQVSYRSGNPVLAADIANAVVTLYNEEAIRADQAAIRNRQTWYHDRLAQIRADIAQAEAARQEIVTAHPNLGYGGVDSDSVMAMQREMTDLELREAALSAQIAYLEGDKSGNPVSGEDMLVKDLRATLAALRQDQAALAQTYGKNHPAMKAVTGKINAVSQDLATAMAQHHKALQDERTVILGSIARLASKINASQAQDADIIAARRKLVALDADIATARTVLTDFMMTHRNGPQTLDLPRSAVQVISAATPPTIAAPPSKGVIMALAAVTGVFLAMFMALIVEKTRDVIRTGAQAAQVTGEDVLAVLPRMRAPKPKTMVTYMADHPASTVAELMRSAYVSLRMEKEHTQSGGQVICMASARKGEGKHTIAVWLASLAALHGDRVLVIDADMRDPTLHTAFGIGNAKGLADYLSDRLPLEEVIYTHQATGVHVITAKAIPTHALTLLGNDRMAAMMRRLRDRYDRIIIVTPPVLEYADARLVSAMADHRLYVVRAGRTRRSDAVAGIQSLRRMETQTGTVIVNDGDV